MDIAVFAVDGAGVRHPLAMTGSAAELAAVRVATRADFLKLVQSPTERLRNLNLLFYVSYFGFDRLSDDFAAQSAALCTMGYRLVDGLSVPEVARRKLWSGIEEVLHSKANVPRGLWLRWHTSVRLVAGYLAFRDKDTQKAAEYFNGIGEFAFDLAHWPAVLTNVLIGIFLAGWTLYERGDFAEAARAWRRAEGVLRYGGATVQLPNFYAYGELSNAIRVAQECYVGCLQAENHGKPVEDVRVIPAGYQLDIHHLPGLLYNLGLK